MEGDDPFVLNGEIDLPENKPPLPCLDDQCLTVRLGIDDNQGGCYLSVGFTVNDQVNSRNFSCQSLGPAVVLSIDSQMGEGNDHIDLFSEMSDQFFFLFQLRLQI